MKLKKRLSKVKRVSERLPELMADKAANLNPLGSPEEPPALKNVPQITTETIGEHREQVLSGARKYIYPLQHSKHRIVTITTAIILVTVAAFLVYCILALYKFYQYNTFLYRVTQVVPFPIARTDGSFVNYENYLFQLRRYTHYYQTQSLDTFSSTPKRELLQHQFLQFRKQALDQVINDAYVKILAQKNGVKVSDKEVNTLIAEVRNQNRLGSNDKVFADVLRNYWGWSVADFRRSLKTQMLANKLSAKLDSATSTKAQAVLVQLRGGADFGQWAKDASNAADAAAGGDYGFGITRGNPNVSPEVINQLFNLKPGQISDVILASRTDVSRPNTLEIVKVSASDGTTVTAQHISFNLKDVNVYINQLKAKQPVKTYVKF